MIPTDHDHDENGNCIPPEWMAPPAWRFSGWDIAGVAFHTAMGVSQAISGGFSLLAQECAAMANYSRREYDAQQARRAQLEAQRAMGADLRAIIEGPDGGSS